MQKSDKDTWVFIEAFISSRYAHKMARLYPIRMGKPEVPMRIANYAMGASKPRVIFYLQCFMLACDRILRSGRLPKIPKGSKWGPESYNVLFTTGPDVISEVFENTPDETTLVIPRKHMRHKGTGKWREQSDLAFA